MILRLFAFSFNYFTHGNVNENAKAAVAVASSWTLRVAEPSDEPYWYSTKEYGGRYLDLNAPLWPTIGGVLMKFSGIKPSEANAFLLFRIMSLVVGMGVVISGYLAGKRIISSDAGIFLSAVLGLSYVLVDYSGNGAFYMAQALLYLLWVLAAISRIHFRALLLAVLSGIGWLLNYQAVVMIAATIILILWERRLWKEKMQSAGLALVVFLLVISPLLIRNARVFGDPLHTTKINLTYVWNKAGLTPVIEGPVKTFHLGFADKLRVAESALLEWLPHNAYYVARKLFVLLPVLFILALYGAVDLAFSKERRNRVFPVILLLGLALSQMLTWPIVQFRYFVPIISLAALIGVEFLYNSIRQSGARYLLMAGTLAGLVLVGFLLFNSNPLHVCYYDCAVTTGPLGRNEELEHLRANNPSLLP